MILLLAGILLLLPCRANEQTGSNDEFPGENLSTRIRKIAKMYQVDITFDESRTNNTEVPAMEIKSGSPETVLARSLSATTFSYRKLSGNSYVIYEDDQKKTTPTGTGSISGVVLDDAGEPLTGATILVQGTTLGTITDMNGQYVLKQVPAGTHVIEVRFISYQTQQVNDVKVAGGKTTRLNVAMKPASEELGEVVVKATYEQASVSALYARQRELAVTGNGISADLIARTSDKNLGETLRRVTGVSTLDNKFIVVRGMGERWNEVSLDGVTMPSTEANNKAFSFDLIPTNIIDNVMVIKTTTPDMNASFAGGFVQVQTKDIPEKNFFSLSIGGTWNSESTGEDQLGRKRGDRDWLGFDDGRRKWPKGLETTPPTELNETAKAQTRLFTEDNFSLYKTKTPLSHNFQLTAGHSINMKRAGDRLGFIVSLSYRNTQGQTPIEYTNRGNWYEGDNNGVTDSDGNIQPGEHNATGNVYQYGTVLAGLFNAGWQVGRHRLSLRNTYTRKFDNNLTVIKGWDEYYWSESNPGAPQISHVNYPTFQDLLQNKLEGQHLAGKVKLGWYLAHTYIKRNQMDGAFTDEWGTQIDGEDFYTMGVEKRVHYENSERDWNWGLSVEAPFNLGKHIRSTAKLGYMGTKKRNTFLFEEAQKTKIDYDLNLPGYSDLPFAEQLDPENMLANGTAWWVPRWVGETPEYEGKVNQHAPYGMFDHRFGETVRLVWGARVEYYKYDEISNPYHSTMPTSAVDSVADKKWQWMPSANLTVTPVKDFNLRLAYSRSVVRPQFMERTRFYLWDPLLSGSVGSRGVTSTTVDALDLKLEWYPGAGEVISAGAFYRYLNDPIERLKTVQSVIYHYFTLQNSDWARNYGLEFELRKNLDFIGGTPLWQNIYLSGNATFTRSKVQAFSQKEVDGEQVKVPVKVKRPLYGQTPAMFNAGAGYEGERLGMNLSWNYTARKLYIIGNEFAGPAMEYEAAHNYLDAQVSYTFARAGLTLKLNGSNLLADKTVFYSNPPEDYEKDEYNASTNKLVPGANEGYDPGHDWVDLQFRTGRSFSASLTWTF